MAEQALTMTDNKIGRQILGIALGFIIYSLIIFLFNYFLLKPGELKYAILHALGSDMLSGVFLYLILMLFRRLKIKV